jgi:hypothetical protein
MISWPTKNVRLVRLVPLPSGTIYDSPLRRHFEKAYFLLLCADPKYPRNLGNRSVIVHCLVRKILESAISFTYSCIYILFIELVITKMFV